MKRSAWVHMLCLGIGLGQLSGVCAQVTTFPYAENFDSVSSPVLPPGWGSSQNRTHGQNDFTTTSVSSHTPPNAVYSSNATIGQSLLTPVFDFAECTPDRICFYIRRSSSHNAGVSVEGSCDGGETYPLQLAPPLTNTGGSEYVRCSIVLPASLATVRTVRFRWRVIPELSGAAGTLRIDDFLLTVRSRHDLALGPMRVLPSSPCAGDTLCISATATNCGSEPAAAFLTEFFIDSNNDSIPQPSELIASAQSRSPLPASDSTEITSSLGSLQAGTWLLIGRISSPGDENLSNNVCQTMVNVCAGRQSVVINEIMYAPCAIEAEYVELMNTSQQSLDMEGWMLAGREGTGKNTTRFLLSTGSRVLHPGEYFTVGSDSSLFHLFGYLRQGRSGLVSVLGVNSLGLNNEGDDIVLLDHTGSVVDSVAYSPSWHSPGAVDPAGRSLERIRPQGRSNDARNWSTCANPVGGTPGRRNSIFADSFSSTGRLSFCPNPFSPDGDGFEDFAVIHYSLPFEVSSISIKIFDVNGRLIRRLANNELGGAGGDVVWDGRDEEKQRARIGMYVVLLEAINQYSGVMVTSKGVVVLAARL